MTSPHILPTMPGRAPGIVGMNPLRLQCADCGTIHEQCARSVALCILTAGFNFHTCETNPPRRCPSCLAQALEACGATRHDDQLREARFRADAQKEDR